MRLTGGAGKSRLAKHLVMNHNAVILSGKLQDMCYVYRKQPIVVFDITRASADHTVHLYSMAEFLKNGLFLSTKYESRQVVFPPPHVIFFSNSHPDFDKWSRDRVKLKDLQKEMQEDKDWAEFMEQAGDISGPDSPRWIERFGPVNWDPQLPDPSVL
ncbi:hypothetical protein DUNSADRAFT_8697, partial [Dunaliella salina]